MIYGIQLITIEMNSLKNLTNCQQSMAENSLAASNVTNKININKNACNDPNNCLSGTLFAQYDICTMLPYTYKIPLTISHPQIKTHNLNTGLSTSLHGTIDNILSLTSEDTFETLWGKFTYFVNVNTSNFIIIGIQIKICKYSIYIPRFRLIIFYSRR